MKIQQGHSRTVEEGEEAPRGDEDSDGQGVPRDVPGRRQRASETGGDVVRDQISPTVGGEIRG